jgi:hypothetical protein
LDVFVAMTSDGSPSIEDLPRYDFARQLKLIIAEEMTVPADPVEPGKVDIVRLDPLYSSESKRLVLYVYGYPEAQRMSNLRERRDAIIRRIKELLELPEDEQCVSFSFRRVKTGDWGKG